MWVYQRPTKTYGHQLIKRIFIGTRYPSALNWSSLKDTYRSISLIWSLLTENTLICILFIIISRIEKNIFKHISLISFSPRNFYDARTYIGPETELPEEAYNTMKLDDRLAAPFDGERLCLKWLNKMGHQMQQDGIEAHFIFSLGDRVERLMIIQGIANKNWRLLGMFLLLLIYVCNWVLFLCQPRYGATANSRQWQLFKLLPPINH